jgi:hypothetical protein
MRNYCGDFRKDTECCKKDGKPCPYEEEWLECPRIEKSNPIEYSGPMGIFTGMYEFEKGKG